jgi:myo-inositol-1(or 4)-monophosphatase
MTQNPTRIELAKEIIIKAGSYLKNEFLKRQGKVKIKSDGSVLLTEDQASENIILSPINEFFPADTILSEETPSEKKSDHVWIIDPLCGSYSYLRGVETWSISLALVHDGVYEAGLVYQPLLETFFIGIKGDGVYRNDVPVAPSLAGSLTGSFISIEHNAISDPKINFPNLIGKIKRLRVAHGSGMELAYVASGSLEAVIKTGQTAEHYSGGRALVEMAGGVFVDLDGEKLPVITDRKTKIDYIAAANREIAGLLVDVIKRYKRN